MSGEYLNIEAGDRIGKYRVIRLSGEFDLNEVSHFEEKAGEILSGGARHVVLDLSQLDYLDSSGIGCIVRLYRDTEENAKGKLVLYHPKEFIEELFEISNLTSFLRVLHTAEELESFCSDQAAD